MLKAQKNPLMKHFGTIRNVKGLLLSATDVPQSAIGSRLTIIDDTGRSHPAEVVGYEADQTFLMPFTDMQGIGPVTEFILNPFKQLPVSASTFLAVSLTPYVSR